MGSRHARLAATTALATSGSEPSAGRSSQVALAGSPNERVTQVILTYAPNLAKDDDAKKMATLAAAKPAFRKVARQEFGRAAASFYGALTAQMLKLKHPLLCDLRGSGLTNGPDEVWNHAIFYYRASYKEILPSDLSDPSNNHYMEIDIKLVANADVGSPPSSSQPGAPAASNSIEVDASSFQNRKSHQVLWLTFDPKSGEITGNDRNQWKHCQNETGAELYAPSFLAVVLPTGTTAATAQANQDPAIDLANGNPFVDLELVAEPNPLLKVRKRYQK
jgi:hypothetical protein